LLGRVIDDKEHEKLIMEALEGGPLKESVDGATAASLRAVFFRRL
jgi:hypothetical protein